jgi:hypothetical protein
MCQRRASNRRGVCAVVKVIKKVTKKALTKLALYIRGVTFSSRSSAAFSGSVHS